MSDREVGVVVVTSRAIARRAHVAALLGARVTTFSRRPWVVRPECAAVAGWGNKRSGILARELAARLGVPALALEDGFLRSAGDSADPQALSLCVDDVGIYYDARAPSRLEQLIASGVSDQMRARARSIAAAWRSHRLSKYNHARDITPDFGRNFVLVVDQTLGDASIEGALAGPRSFAQMLEAALDEHPDSPVVLKIHPEVAAGRKRGHFESLSPGMAARVRVVGQHRHAPDLIEEARAVYTVSSQVGFEALLWERPVRVFGMPFYAGWGLTADALARPPRRNTASREDVVYAALVAYPRYVDPETGLRCEVERVVEHLGLQRRMRARFPSTVYAVGFSRWKKPIARAFFGGSDVRFVRDAQAIPSDAQAVATWGQRPVTLHGAAAPTVIRVEDGFVRSVGLGARLVAPLSWVQDDCGIYYDATRESRLERMLNDGAFDAGTLARARDLARTLVELGISKYNLDGVNWKRPCTARQVILVAGQVESDASLRLGSPAITSNLALLDEVRRAEPDACIVYKPHPDVAAGLRKGAIAAETAARLCDQVLSDESIVGVLRQVDAVHVMTSLTGFEALLHGKPVTTYGMPFYAGWGLTADRLATPRRRRAVSLDELIAAVLIRYPTYVSTVTGRFTTPERAILELMEMRRGLRNIARRARWPDWVLRIAAGR
jgi:capsular polysaccharide export protein